MRKPFKPHGNNCSSSEPHHTTIGTVANSVHIIPKIDIHLQRQFLHILYNEQPLPHPCISNPTLISRLALLNKRTNKYSLWSWHPRSTCEKPHSGIWLGLVATTLHTHALSLSSSPHNSCDIFTQHLYKYMKYIVYPHDITQPTISLNEHHWHNLNKQVHKQTNISLVTGGTLGFRTRTIILCNPISRPCVDTSIPESHSASHLSYCTNTHIYVLERTWPEWESIVKVLESRVTRVIILTIIVKRQSGVKASGVWAWGEEGRGGNGGEGSVIWIQILKRKVWSFTIRT